MRINGLLRCILNTAKCNVATRFSQHLSASKVCVTEPLRLAYLDTYPKPLQPQSYLLFCLHFVYITQPFWLHGLLVSVSWSPLLAVGPFSCPCSLFSSLSLPPQSLLSWPPPGSWPSQSGPFQMPVAVFSLISTIFLLLNGTLEQSCPCFLYIE